MKVISIEKKMALALSFALALVYQVSIQQAQAGRIFGENARGTGTAFRSSNQNGQRAGWRVTGTTGGAGLSGAKWTNPNTGNQFSRANGHEYQQGVGEVNGRTYNVQSPQGTSFGRTVGNGYNAQTGTGQRDVTQQTTAANGNQYGYTMTSDYTKGEGVTSKTINTDNHGDFTIPSPPPSN